MTQERINPGVTRARRRGAVAQFTDEENARLLALVKRLYVERFAENQTKLGKALGVTQSAARNWIVSDKAGFSFDTARNVARISGVPLESLVALPSPASGDLSSPNPQLEAVIDYHSDRKRWSDHTIAIARGESGRMRPMTKAEWEGFLDRLEELLGGFYDPNVPPIRR